MNGRLIAIVGPSGSGKDTLIFKFKEKFEADFPTRFITRPSFPNDEKYNSVSKNTFANLKNTEQLAFHWSAHGLSYGIPASIDQSLRAGRNVIFNCSRAAINKIRKKYPVLEIISIIVPPEILKKRLIARGRESIEEIDQRLCRHIPLKIPGCIEVDNSGTIQEGVENLIMAINQPIETSQ